MVNKEEIQEKIKQGDLNEAMAMAMLEAMKLEIVTTSNDVDKSTSCRTVINVLENEIEHELGDNSLKQFHFCEVEKAHSTILKNVQNLQSMFKILQDNATKLSE